MFQLNQIENHLRNNILWNAKVGKLPLSRITKSKPGTFIFFIDSLKEEELFYNYFGQWLLGWEWASYKQQPSLWKLFHTDRGHLFLVSLHHGDKGLCRTQEASSLYFTPQILRKNDHVLMKDIAGEIFRSISSLESQPIFIDFHTLSRESQKGFMIGLGLASYQFKHFSKPQSLDLFLSSDDVKALSEDLKDAQLKSMCSNTARHLVNLPPEILNPKTYSQWVQHLFSKKKNVKVKILGKNEIQKQGLNLLWAVGKGSEHEPCLVHIQYSKPLRKNHSTSEKKITSTQLKSSQYKDSNSTKIFVGKGVTFDSGGLDLKPSSGMRLMKKDMGGSAAVLALALWVVESNYSENCDFYLSLAENYVSEKSFCPGDIIKSFSGKTVEIDNTDAEGRLVLADAISYALSRSKNVDCIIDVATLTGAIKVGLGSNIGGLFSNSSELEHNLLTAASEAGDYLWSMPLEQTLRSCLKSNVADMVNSCNGFGGAITAALFLESFVEGLPWGHLDIYAWTDTVRGAYSEVGGTGQAVQALIQFLENSQRLSPKASSLTKV